MKPDRALHVQVAAAVGAMLVGRSEITLAEVETALPSTILAGRPSHKSMTKALVAAGWVGIPQAGGGVVYRAPDVEPHDGGIGDNVGDDRLRLLIERVERIREDKRALAEAERDVFAEAKSVGFEPAAMKIVLKERATDPEKRVAAAAITDLYRRAMGMVPC